jgi:hypothetical protein
MGNTSNREEACRRTQSPGEPTSEEPVDLRKFYIAQELPEFGMLQIHAAMTNPTSIFHGRD